MAIQEPKAVTVNSVFFDLLRQATASSLPRPVKSIIAIRQTKSHARWDEWTLKKACP